MTCSQRKAILFVALALPVAAARAQKIVPDVPEVPIEVPDPSPTGLLLAWKPMLLSVRVDTGTGLSRFGNDRLQPLRGLARYTFRVIKDRPFFGRVEVEGGQFQTDAQTIPIGTKGTDYTARILAGAATRIAPGFLLIASAGLITRYQYGGNVEQGAPTIGILGVASNMELQMRLLPSTTLSLFLEGGLAPWPYLAQKNLGDLSDSSELRARVQVSFDLSPRAAVDVGYDFTRWHAAFANSTIRDPRSPGPGALLIEGRQHATTLGMRWKM